MSILTSMLSVHFNTMVNQGFPGIRRALPGLLQVVASYNNCNPGGPVGLPQGCKPIHWNPNTFLEKKVCWQIAQKLQKTSVANFTYLFWTLYFASRTKNKLKQLYFNGAVSMFFQQSLHLPKNKQPKWQLLWSHDPWDLISWFPLLSLGPSPMENPMLKG